MTTEQQGYTVNCAIVGSAPLLQHAFGAVALESVQESATKRTGTPDYSAEFLETMYTENGLICQPSTHIEGALVKAAVAFKIKGGGGRKTYKDLVRGSCFVSPAMIPHLWNGETIPAPDASLLQHPTEALSVNVMRVIIGRAAIARQRLQVSRGWRLEFSIDVIDYQLQPEVLSDILHEAGRAVGIGDYRPRFGRFLVDHFEVR